MSLFTKQSMEYVSKCHGAKTYVVLSKAPNGKPLDVVMCSVCREPTRTVLKGGEMRPIEGGIYCQICAGKLTGRAASERLALKYPAAHKGKGTCWGCGETVKLYGASTIVKKEIENGG